MKFLVLALVLSASVSVSSQAGQSWESYTHSRLLQKELAFYGVDADVRRLLEDPTFDEDLQRWWQAVNPLYIENSLRGGYEGETLNAEVAARSRATGLKHTAQAHFDFRVAFARAMEDAIPSEKVSRYLAYFFQTGQNLKARSLLRIYAQEWMLFSQEVTELPRLNGSPQVQQLSGGARMLETSQNGISQCMNQGSLSARGDCLVWNATDPAVRAFAECAMAYNGPRSLPSVGACLKRAIPFTDPLSVGYEGAPHAVSRTGVLRGNNVIYFTDNRRDPEIQKYYEDLYRGPQNPVAQLNGRTTVEAFASLFSQGKNPFPGTIYQAASAHPAFQTTRSLSANQAIFPELLRGIQSAKHTIFIDIFFLGGTMGVAFAQELIAKAKSGVRVYVLHDPYNGFDYTAEIDPVFRMIVGYSNRYPDQMTVAGSYIFAHRTGLPSYFDALLPDAIVSGLMAQSKALFSFSPPLFPKAKSDHSKVMVIDGAGLWQDSVPVAYVGSKNWTDSSGAMTFDEVARVSGPAAVAVQDTYYWDLWYALRSGGSGRVAMSPEQIEKTLDLVDPLGRKWDAANARVVPSRGGLTYVGAQKADVPVRLAENNMSGGVTSVLDQNIQAIRSAKHQIIVNDQFLYDQRIVDELLDKAKSNPNVKIYVMLEPLSKTSGQQAEVMGGMPNLLYADMLTHQTVGLDAQGNPKLGPAWPNIFFKWKHVPHSEEFHHEYHMKTITVDGFTAEGKRAGSALPSLITGSANKDHMTQHGAFREMQLEIYDQRPCQPLNAGVLCGAVAEADRIFWRRWTNQATEDEGGGSEEMDPYRFLLPPQMQQASQAILKRDMTSAEFLFFMRSLIHTAYDLERSSVVE